MTSIEPCHFERGGKNFFWFSIRREIDVRVQPIDP